MNTHFGLQQFLKRYPSDEACLKELLHIRYPNGITCVNCKVIRKFYKIKNRPAYECAFCGKQIYPLAGTIFHKSSTSLKLWFYAIFIMTQTRSGVSAKQLERELRVTYKCAFRMFHQIRKLMSEGTIVLNGEVEVDESFFGGKGKNRRYVAQFQDKPKQVVMGMVERNGRTILRHIPNTGKYSLLKEIQEHIDPSSHVITDQYSGYIQLKKHGYKHSFVNHKITYVVGNIHTNNIENIWSILKRGIYGVYRQVDKKYLQAYANEYAWRFNNRHAQDKMFDLLLARVALPLS